MDFSEIIEAITKIFQVMSPYLFLGAAAIGVGIKARNFLRKLKWGKEEVRKEKTVRKLLRTLSGSQLIDVLMVVNDLTSEIPVEELFKLINDFRKKYQIEYGMRETMVDIKELLSIGVAVSQPTVSDILDDYRRRKRIASIRNKKRWNKLRYNKDVDQALDGILNVLHRKLEKHALEAKKKAGVEQIQNVINAIRSQENIEANREKRKAIELLTEKARAAEKTKELKEIAEKLHSLFSGQKSANGSP